MIRLKKVKTYDGYKSGQRIESFEINTEIITVEKVIETKIIEDTESRSSRRKFFKVLSSNGQTYRIIYEIKSDCWYLE